MSSSLEITKPKTRGEQYESVAFNFCKIATVLLLLEVLRVGAYALPITAGLAVVLFVLAHIFGARESRCILRKPLWIAAFWSAIIALWLWRHNM